MSVIILCLTLAYDFQRSTRLIGHVADTKINFGKFDEILPAIVSFERKFFSVIFTGFIDFPMFDNSENFSGAVRHNGRRSSLKFAFVEN